MAKPSIRRQTAVSRAQTRGPSAAAEWVDNAPGYLALRLRGLAALVRAASTEDDLSAEAAFFVATALDDVAARLAR